MTSTSRTRTVRETTACCRSRGRTRAVIVTLEPPGDQIELRLKGERKRYRLPLSVVYCMAVRSHVEAEKARKKAERAARKNK